MICTDQRFLQRDDELLLVDCGKCLPCLINKRSDWSFRLMQEYKAASCAAFITLTYHPKFVPDQGLSKRHVQLFMKRLRKLCPERLRYFLVGEYGTRSGRPHYHIILFNYEGGLHRLYEAWSTVKGEPFGIVHIGKVTEASIRYTTKYVIQRNAYSYGSKSRPFMLCSRAYGLGLNYLTDEMVAWHRGTRSVKMMTPELARTYTMIYGEKGRLPRYYKDKIWPLVKDTYWQYIREKISKKLGGELIQAQQKNVCMIREAGYTDPDRIIAEMRNAVLSRVKEKVAYTQKF